MTERERGAGTTFDLIVRGGVVFDGAGGAGVRADVGVADDRIARVGDLSLATAGQTLDATGLRVAPGFIDIHTHSDVSATYAPDQSSALSMGVTTQVTGNCGLALGFATGDKVFAFEKRWLAPHGARITWDSFAAHLEKIETMGIATNFVPLAGHGTLRKRVLGVEERRADASDLAAMRRELETAFAAGAWGFSSGLEYTPSSYADEDELAELCRVAAAWGGFYATHLRNEGDTLVEAVQEALNVATRARLPLQLSHHKAEGRANWGKVATTLGMVTTARANGLDVQLDQYPYTAFMTALSVQLLPRWAQSGSIEEITARLLDPAQRAGIRAEILRDHPDWDDAAMETSPWRHIQIGVCRGRPEAQGVTLARLAREAGQCPLDYALDLLTETGGFVSAVNFAIGEADIADIMRYPWTMIGSDGVGTHPSGSTSEDKIHPRAYGTFPRVLGHYARDLGILTEAQALHKMTGLPAARLGLADRGRIAPGCYADLTLYDAATIGDRATFDDPHRYAQGVHTVVVNGRVAYRQDAPTEARAGRILRRAP